VELGALVPSGAGSRKDRKVCHVSELAVNAGVILSARAANRSPDP
jgi:hypothetical protein